MRAPRSLPRIMCGVGSASVSIISAKLSNMEQDIPIEKIFELGDRNRDRLDYDQAIHYYNLLLRKDPADKTALLRLADIHAIKAEKEPVYYVLAMEACRKILKTDPMDHEANEKLILTAIKAGTLGDLAREYREKLKKDPSNKIYKNYLNRISLMSIMGKDAQIPDSGYTPGFILRMFFDLGLLPISVIFILFYFWGPKYKSTFTAGTAMFAVYLCYRALLYFFSKK
ncbi:MAG: hypothetical protein HY746_08300 [Elusimicrobia bacterium]|nr:hypothetical protein [Elusimicrobiota bacterium]